MKTKAEILKSKTIDYPFVITEKSEHHIHAAMDEYAEQFNTKSTISFDRSTLNDMAKKHIENIGFGTGTNITVHALKCCMVDFYLDNQPEMKQTAMDFAEWCIVHAWEIDYREQKSHTTSELFAKFDAERNQQQSELTCPECLSNRILEWPDKYQCRKCEHVWERSAK